MTEQRVPCRLQIRYRRYPRPKQRSRLSATVTVPRLETDHRRHTAAPQGWSTPWWGSNFLRTPRLAYAGILQKIPHAPGFGPLLTHKPALAHLMILAQQSGNHLLIPCRAKFQFENPGKNNLTKSCTDFKRFTSHTLTSEAENSNSSADHSGVHPLPPEYEMLKPADLWSSQSAVPT